MANKLVVAPAPHVQTSQSTARIMRDVVIALMPALVVSMVVFGVDVLRVTALSVACCVLFEYLIQRFLVGGSLTIGNWSAVVTGVLLAVCVGVFLFTGLWGLNHFGPGVGETLGLDVREYSKEELIAATNYYAAQATQYAGTVQRDEQGRAQLADFQTRSKQAGDGYLSLRSAYPQFDGAVDPVKSLLSWRLFSQFGTTGIFICFTGESCVNPDTYEAWVPFTMCHEIAHRQAVAAEDEANFCAYLACMENPRNDFRYSGAFAAYIYCNNALAKVDRSAAASIWKNVADGVRADAQAANEHYAQYEGKVQDAAQKVNDAYLKAFSEESGVQSYGEVADLLIAWYLQKTA